MPATMCMNCQTEFKCVQQGVVVIEMFSEPPIPYALWSADIHQCPCGTRIIGAWAKQPFALHYQENFREILDYNLNDPNISTIELHERRNAKCE